MNRVGEALCAALREDTAALPALAPDDWRAVASLAIRHRVGPLLFSKSHLPFPDDVRSQLRARAELSAKRALRLQAGVRELADAAAAQALTMVVLKGLHLATSVYASPGLREMGDIDVLVPAEQIGDMREVAKKLGYRAPPFSGSVATHHLPPMMKGQVCLEIHWQLFDDELGEVAEPAGLIARAVPYTQARTAGTLCTEDLLLHLCVHAAAHHLLETGIQPLSDVQALVHHQGGTLDWHVVVQRAHEWGAERSLALILALARVHFGVTIPDDVQDALTSALPSPKVIDDAMVFLFEHAEHLLGTSEAAARLLEIRGTTARLKHVAAQLWRPQARVTSVATRAVGLSWRHGRWLWRASRDRHSPLHEAVDRRNALAAWIRGR